MSADDIALMLAFKGGDYGAFAVLVDRHQDALVQFFYLQALDRHVAEDCAQEVWSRVFKARHDYEPRAKFKTYLLRIARNLWIDRFRSQSRRSPEVSIESSAGDPEQSGLGRVLAANVSDPSARMARAELKCRIEEAVAALPEQQREVFVLAEFEGLRYADIAEVLDVPIGTVKSRMFAAVRRLRESLRREIT